MAISQAPNVALAPQIRFRHTMLLTPKLTKTLNHTTSRPKVSFAAASWRLGMPSHVSNFVTLGFRGKGIQIWKNTLEAPPRDKTTMSDCRRAGKHNGVLTYCVSKWHTYLIFCFTADIHYASKREYTMNLKMRTVEDGKIKTTEQSVHTTIAHQHLKLESH